MNDIALIIICILGQASYIYFSSKKKSVLGVVGKTIASICFILIGYRHYKASLTNVGLFILIGMVFDGLGDLLLGLRNLFLKKQMFLAGTFSFMIGHIFYFYATIHNVKKQLIILLIVNLAVASLLYALLNKICHFKKPYKQVFPAYSFLVSGVFIIGITNYVLSPTTTGMLYMIGTILFATSDYLLAVYNFSSKKKWLHPVYSFAYYIGQILISLSI